MKNKPNSAAEILRLKAEKILKEREKKTSRPSISETDNLRIIHELQVHQIELEMQNEELVLAKEREHILKEKYIHLYDFAPSGYITLSKKAEINELNFRAASILCKERTALIKNRFDLLISVDTRPIFNSFFYGIMENKTKDTCEVILNIGNNVPTHVYLIGVIEEKSNQFFLTLLNITDRKKIDLIVEKQNKELRKLNADKDGFMSILGHDLRSPFMSILGFSELLLKNIKHYDLKKIETYASYIHQSTIKGFKLLEDLLLWSNTQSGYLTFHPKKIKFKHLFTEVVETLIPIANAKSITINCTDEINLTVYADNNMLQTILRNLISNAIKFTHKGGKIYVSVFQNASLVNISVTDNGIGIDPLALEQLFNISEMNSTKGTEDEDGSGLGLVLCKEFVRLHEGTIWAESELGIGSTFYFTLNQALTLPSQKN